MSAALAPYLQSLAARARDRREERKRRAAEASARLPEAAATLRALGARRVLLFGSLLRGELYPDSDVDLAVEGLAADRYFEALDRANMILRFAVDLVRIEEAPPSLLARIEREGEALD